MSKFSLGKGLVVFEVPQGLNEAESTYVNLSCPMFWETKPHYLEFMGATEDVCEELLSSKRV